MIILFGLAGSGKGTQGRALAEIFGWRWVSVGEAIRQAGGYEEIINAGNLIPDDEVIKIMNNHIRKIELEGYDAFLDGYPRDIVQAEYIVNNMPNKIDGAILLEVPKEELYERLSLRSRDDDKDRESIEKRFGVFEQNIYSILDLFSAHNIPVAKADGTGSIEEVTARLVKIVKELNPNATEQKDDVNGGEIEHSYGE